MTCFTWLHITDFHQGTDIQDSLRSSTRQQFFRDLRNLNRNSGPWDLILFTGDLTNRGEPREFELIGDFLEGLREEIVQIQPDAPSPIMLTVPGNHDLVRPQPKDGDQEFNDALEELLDCVGWSNNKVMQNQFWRLSKSIHHRVINEAFQNYVGWWDRRQPEGIINGFLPGDFSYTFINKESAKLGILGLNSSFLQLSSADYLGKLVINPLQFDRACFPDGTGSGDSWVSKHDVCLLMTHHPKSWLTAESQTHLEQHIHSDHFAVHLCGHMHTPNRQDASWNNAEEQRICQARSLFGVERMGSIIDRSHGYMVGKIRLSQQDQGRLVFWPRVLYQYRTVPRMAPDHECFVLSNDSHTQPIPVSLKRLYRGPYTSDPIPNAQLIERCHSLVDQLNRRYQKIQLEKRRFRNLQSTVSEVLNLQNEVISKQLCGNFIGAYNAVADWNTLRKDIEEIIKSIEEIIDSDTLEEGIIDNNCSADQIIAYRNFCNEIKSHIESVENVVSSEWMDRERIDKQRICNFVEYLSRLGANLNLLLQRFSADMLTYEERNFQLIEELRELL